MKAGTCCKKTAGGVLPGVLLLLVPKCPVCLALYLSAATGIGIPFTTARYLRILLIAACVGALMLFAWRRWRDWRRYQEGAARGRSRERPIYPSEAKGTDEEGRGEAGPTKFKAGALCGGVAGITGGCGCGNAAR